jgi:hypothetical protein
MKQVIFLAISASTCILGSCRLLEFHPEPERDQYEQFSRISGERRHPDSIEAWIDASPDVGKIKIARSVSIFGVCKERDPALRLAYAKLYLKLYLAVLHNKYGCLDDVTVDDNGQVVSRSGKKVVFARDDLNVWFLVDFDSINVLANGQNAKRNPELVWLHKELEKLGAFRAFKDQVAW